MGALLCERGHHLEAQRLGQFTQLVQRCLKLDIAYRRQLHGSDESALRVTLTSLDIRSGPFLCGRAQIVRPMQTISPQLSLRVHD